MGGVNRRFEGANDPPPFDFRAEMHTTRVHADELLAAGKIEEAKIYWRRALMLDQMNETLKQKVERTY